MPGRAIPNMPQTPSRRTLNSVWAKLAESLANENELADLGKYIGEYLRNTDGLRNFVVGQETDYGEYETSCIAQGEHVAARQNHTDAAVMGVGKENSDRGEQVKFGMNYHVAMLDRLDSGLETIEKSLPMITMVELGRMIQHAMKDCKGQMVEQLTDQVVGKHDRLAEKERKEGIRRGKQVVTIPSMEGLIDFEFELGATFSNEENEKVTAVLQLMEVRKQVLEASKHAPPIPPGEMKQ